MQSAFYSNYKSAPKINGPSLFSPDVNFGTFIKVTYAGSSVESMFDNGLRLYVSNSLTGYDVG